MTDERTRAAKYDKKHFELLLTLYSKQPWLSYRKEAVLELHESCDSFDELALIYELLNRFTYIERTTFSEFIKTISSLIIDDWNLPTENTIIAAIAFDQAPDSSHLVIYELRSVLSRKGWHERSGHIFFSTLDKVFKEMKKRSRSGVDNINIVLVDEFVGTGSTMESRIRSIK